MAAIDILSSLAKANHLDLLTARDGKCHWCASNKFAGALVMMKFNPRISVIRSLNNPVFQIPATTRADGIMRRLNSHVPEIVTNPLIACLTVG